MRVLILAALSWPALLVAQEAVRQQSLPQLEEWRKQQAVDVAAYHAERGKSRAKLDKSLMDAERKTEQWVQVARDEFGLTEAQRRDPDAVRRDARERRARFDVDDKSVARLDTIWRGEDFDLTLAALQKRRSDIEGFLVELDTVIKYAKAGTKHAQKHEDYFKSEDRPNLAPSTRAFLKRAIDYFEKAVKAERAIADFESARVVALRAEVGLLDRHIAAANAVVSRR